MKFRDKAVMGIATGAWVGRIPVAPGTFGSLAALPVCWLLSLPSPAISFFLILMLIGVAVWSAHEASKQMNEKDPHSIVIDEIAGMAITLWALPFNVWTVLAGFIVFRILDVFKPFPVGYCDRNLKGGVGIVMDDMAAGIMANLILRLLLFLL